MTTLEIDNETTALLAEMAEQEQTTLAQLANRLLTECLEDWQDARAADEVLAGLERGESKLLSWDEVKAGLYDLTGTVLSGHHQPLSAWVLCLYFMGLSLSNQQISQELDLNKDDLQ